MEVRCEGQSRGQMERSRKWTHCTSDSSAGTKGVGRVKCCSGVPPTCAAQAYHPGVQPVCPGRWSMQGQWQPAEKVPGLMSQRTCLCGLIGMLIELVTNPALRVPQLVSEARGVPITSTNSDQGPDPGEAALSPQEQTHLRGDIDGHKHPRQGQQHVCSLRKTEAG